MNIGSPNRVNDEGMPRLMMKVPSPIFGEGIIGVILVDDEGAFSKIFGEGIVGVVFVVDEGKPRLMMKVSSPKYLGKVLLVWMNLVFCLFFFCWARSFPCRRGEGVQGNLISIVKSIRF